MRCTQRGATMAWSAEVMRRLPRLDFLFEKVPAVFDPYNTEYTQSIIVIGMLVMLVAFLVTVISFVLSCIIYSVIKRVISDKLHKYVHFKTMHLAYRASYIAVASVFVGLLCYCIFNAIEITYLFDATVGTMQGVLHSVSGLAGVDPIVENLQNEITSIVLSLEQQCADGKSKMVNFGAELEQYFDQVEEAARQLASAASVADNFTAGVGDVLPRVEITIVTIPLCLLTMVTLSICQLCPCIWGECNSATAPCLHMPSRRFVGHSFLADARSFHVDALRLLSPGSHFRCHKNVFTVVFMGGVIVCLPVAILSACYTSVAVFAVDACANNTASLANAVPDEYSCVALRCPTCSHGGCFAHHSICAIVVLLCRSYVEYYVYCNNDEDEAAPGTSNLDQWNNVRTLAVWSRWNCEP